MKINLKVEGATEEQILKYEEIFSILLQKGALDGVRNGSVILHFDGNCVFQAVELDYRPWIRRKI